MKWGLKIDAFSCSPVCGENAFFFAAVFQVAAGKVLLRRYFTTLVSSSCNAAINAMRPLLVTVENLNYVLSISLTQPTEADQFVLDFFCGFFVQSTFHLR